MSHEHKGHPLNATERQERAGRQAARVREGHHKTRHGHEHLDVPLRERPHMPAPHYIDEGKAAIFALLAHMTPEEVWVQFWHHAKEEKNSDSPGPARDHLIRHYGMHGFLEERYKREQKRGAK